VYSFRFNFKKKEMMNWEYPSFRGIREREMCGLEYRVKKNR